MRPTTGGLSRYLHNQLFGIGVALLGLIVLSPSAAAEHVDLLFGSGLAAQESALVIPSMEALTGGQGLVYAEQAARVNPQAIAARASSRTRYAALSGDRAARLLATSFPQVVSETAGGVPTLPAGERVTGFETANMAEVEVAPKQKTLLVAAVPLAVRTTSNARRWAPIDLALHATTTGFVPDRPLVGIRIPVRLSEGTDLPDSLSITPINVHGAALHGAPGRQDGTTVFYGNTERDTDTFIKPTLSGVEASTVLRSSGSPTSLYFRLGAPQGATLARSSRSNSILVQEAGRIIGEIAAPRAVDASGTPVPVRMTLSGRTLRISLDHRTESYLYPIVVDPEFVAVTETGIHGPWTFTQAGGYTSYTEEAFADLKMKHTGPISSGDWGMYALQTTGYTKIYKFGAVGMGAQYEFGEAGNLGVVHFMAISGPHEWHETRSDSHPSVCAVTSCSAEGGEQANSAIFEATTTENKVGELWFTAGISSPEIYLSQEKGLHTTAEVATAPEQIEYTSGGKVIKTPNVFHGFGGHWFGPNTGAFEYEAWDGGLGVSESGLVTSVGGKWLEEPGSIYGNDNFLTTAACKALHCSYSQKVIGTYETTRTSSGGVLPEGELETRIRARSPMPGTVSTEYSGVARKLKVDARAPTVTSFSGLRSSIQKIEEGGKTREYTLYELGETETHVKVEVQDGEGTTPSSGVASIALSIDGREVGKAGGSCETGPCKASNEWSINGGELGAGQYTLTVVATDRAGNVSSTNYPLSVSHAEPLAIGPGSVNPQSGDLATEATDVALTGGLGTLGVTRHYDSRNPAAGEGGPLGPEWSVSLGHFAEVEELPDGSILLVSSQGLTQFQKTKSGTYEAPAGDSNLSLEYEPAKPAYIVRDAGQGTMTEFTKPTGASVWMATTSDGPAATDTLTAEYQVAEPKPLEKIVEPTLELAPHPSATCSKGKLERGCRGLEFIYDESTTAKGEAASEWGSYKGRLKEVIAVAYNPTKGVEAVTSTAVAAYEYDALGRLRAEWDPRITPSLKTTYGYDSENHLTAVDAPGTEPWALVYGSTIGDVSRGRLIKAIRPPASRALVTSPLPSANTAAPKITGSGIVGYKLAVSTGTWTNSPIIYGYQWEDCNAEGKQCSPIAGATNANYTVTESDIGHTLLAVVTATNNDGTVGAASAPVVTGNEAEITKYAVPSGSFPASITIGADKNLWVGQFATKKIAKVTTAGVITEYSVASEPVSVATGSDGNVWFGAYGAAKIGKITTSGTVTEYTLPTGAEASALTAGPDGNIWYADGPLSKIGKITTSGTITEYALPAGSGPDAITSGPDGNLWFGDFSSKKIGKITTGGTITEYSVGLSSLWGPGNIISGPDGKIWFSVGGIPGALYKITTTGTGLTEYPLPAGSEGVSGLTKGPDGNVWFTLGEKANKVGKITTSGSYTTYGGELKGPGAITTGPDEQMWLTETSGSVDKMNPTPTQGSAIAASAGWTVEYGVAVSGSGAPHQMTAAELATWDQTDLPIEATAMFAPDEPMGWPATDYNRATITYLDGQSRPVNLAGPTGAIATTEYNSENDAVRSLSAANRATALKEANPAAAAALLDSKSTYSEGRLTETWGPQHTVKLKEDGGAEVLARSHEHYYYDEGAPTGGETYNLVTKTTTGAELAGGQEFDKRTTTSSYSGQSNLGWKLRKATSVTVDPGGLNLTTTTKYDPNTGNVTETQGAAAAGTDSHIPPAFSSAFGKAGANNGELKEPRAEAVVGSNIMVLDTGNSRIEEYSPTGTYITAFSRWGKENGQLENPYAMVADASGNLYVADSTNNRIEIFNPSHGYSSQFGTEGTAAGQFKEPKGITRTSSGTLWVTDANNNRIEKFNEKGEFQLAIGWGVSNGEAKFQICTSSCRAGLSGTGAGEFKEPRGLSVSSAGNIWVADYGNSRVQEFNEKGEFLLAIGWGVSNGEATFQTCTSSCHAGIAGAGPGQFNQPKTLTVDPNTGNLWVADSINGRLEQFTGAGAYLTAAGGKGTGNGQFEESAGIAFSSTGTMWVSDVKNNRIQKWVPTYSGAAGAHDTKTIYYTAGTEAEVAECRNHIEWVGLPCEKVAVAQPGVTGMPELPATIVTYNLWNQEATNTELAGGASRVKTNTFDTAGRPVTTEETAGIDTPMASAITDKYNEHTGALETQSITVGSTVKTITTVRNNLGQRTEYTDADGNSAKYEYEAEGDNRLTKITDAKGYQEFKYDATTGLLREVIDSSGAAFKITRDVEGRIMSDAYPNGMTAYTGYNATGAATSLEYKKVTNCGASCTWFADTVVPGIHGETMRQTSTLSEEPSETYDAAGRLTEVQEKPAGQGCKTRLYALDEDGNRVSQTVREPGTEGKCATEGGATAWHTYDTADRLTDPGIVYEPFGNVTTQPSADAGEHAITTSYYVDGQVSRQTQNEETTEYELDPEARPREIIASGKAANTSVVHYDAPGSSPAWIAETGEKWTRNVPGPDGELAAVQTNSGTTLQLHDLAGNIVATASMSETETKLLKTYNSTEYGVPSSSEAPPKYAWLGGLGVTTMPEDASGTVTQDGVSYVPQTGQTLQTSRPQLPLPTNSILPFSASTALWVIDSGIEASSHLVAKAQEARLAVEDANEPAEDGLEPPAGGSELGGCTGMNACAAGAGGCKLQIVIGQERNYVYARGWFGCGTGTLAKYSELEVCLISQSNELETSEGFGLCSLAGSGYNAKTGEWNQPLSSKLYAHQHEKCEGETEYVAWAWEWMPGAKAHQHYSANWWTCGSSVEDEIWNIAAEGSAPPIAIPE